MKVLCSVLGLWFFLAMAVPGTVVAEEDSGISGDIFGKRGGYVHGVLSVAEEWTDNLFYDSDDTQSDFVTYVSPGIRLSIPGTKEELLTVDGSTTAPGGMAFGRMDVGGGRRFQAYLSYAPEFEFYADNSDEDTTTHLANGLLSWRLRSGLALELIDQYTVGYQDYDKGLSISRMSIHPTCWDLMSRIRWAPNWNCVGGISTIRLTMMPKRMPIGPAQTKACQVMSFTG